MKKQLTLWLCKIALLLAFSPAISNNINPFPKNYIPFLNKPVQEKEDLKLKEKAQGWMQNQPVQFLENKGQMVDVNNNPAPYVLFEASAQGMNLYVTEDGLSYVFTKLEENEEEEREKENSEKGIHGKNDENIKVEYTRIEMILKGASIKKENIIKEGKSFDFTQYFLGHCPDGITDVHKYEKITIKEVYPGIDWVLYNSDKKGFKYDFIVHPGANPKQIKMVYSSLKPLTLNEEGNIEIKTKLGTLTENAPVSYQNNKEVPSSFVRTLNQKNEKGVYNSEIQFGIENYNINETLIIDPQLGWATYIHTSMLGVNGLKSIACDPSGNVLITGYNSGTGVILNPGSGAYFQGTILGGTDMYIAKFSNAGVLIWGTYYTGAGSSYIHADNSGNVYITGGGGTATPLFNPGGGAYFQTPSAGIGGALILKFSNAGVRLWATIIGGTINGGGGVVNNGYSICTDASNNMYLVGTTSANNFPLINSGGYFQSTISGWGAAFISKFNNVGALTWSTYFSSTGFLGSSGAGICSDPFGNIFITGYGSVPVLNSGGYFQGTIAGANDAYVAKFDNASVLKWSTYYGGSLNDVGVSICSDFSGNIFVTGTTVSTNFPVLNPGCGAYFQNTYGGGWTDAFILKFTNTGVRLWATYYGGLSNEQFAASPAITTDPCGNVFVGFDGVNVTNPSATTPLQPSPACVGGLFKSIHGSGQQDNVLLKFSNNGVRLWATYTGATSVGFRISIATDAAGNLFATGEWQSTTPAYPLVNPGGGAHFQTTGTGTDDGYLLKFIPDPPSTYTKQQTNPTTCGTCNGVASVSVNCGSGPFNYLWSTAAQTVCTTSTVSTITGLCPGNYWVEVKDANCHKDTVFYTITGSLGSAPNVSAGPTLTLNCIATSGTLNATSSSGGVITFSWSGPGIVSGGTTSTPTVNVAGIYTVVATNSVGCTNSATVSVISNTTAPVLTAAVSGSLNCLITNVTLTGTSAGNTIVWNGGSLVNAPNPSNVSANGNYTATATGAVNGCTASVMVSVLQNTTVPVLTAAVSGSLNCLITNVTLTGTSAGNTIVWNGGSLVNAPNPSNVSSNGNYTATATNAVNGCTASVVVAVLQNTIVPALTAVTSGSLNCLVTNVTLTGTSAGNTIVWNGGSLVNAPNPSNVNTIGTYTATVTSALSGCTNTAQVTVIQNTTQPNVNAGSDQTITCIQKVVTLNGSSTTTGATFTWQPLNINTAIVATTFVGTHTLTVTDPFNGCTYAATVQVIQNANFPNATISNSGQLTCVTSSLVLIGNSSTSGVTYQWIGGPSVNTYSVSSTGVYTLVVTNPANGCSSTATTAVTQAPSFNLTTNSFSVNCFGNTNGSATALPFNGVGPYTYLWNNSSNQTTQTATGLGVGSYTVIVTDSGTGCTQMAVVTILQPLQLTVVINASKNSVCQGESIGLNALVNNGAYPLSYNWSNSQTTNPVNSIMNISGNYFVTVTDANGCSGSASIFINVFPAPNVNFMASKQTGCEPLCVTFTTAANAASYTWKFSNGNGSNQPNPTECFKAGDYDVSLSVADTNGCTNSKTFANYIHVYPNPIASFSESENTVSLLEPVVSFSNTSTGANHYYWHFGEPNTYKFSTQQNPTYTYNNSGTFLVTLIAINNYGCADTAYRQIKIEDDFAIYIPNTFTPNEDNLNDTWGPKGVGISNEDYELVIFDRWGQKLFVSNTFENQWNGFYRGELVKNDTYVYKLQCKPVNSSKEKYFTGHINVLK